jgi:hypothetical protein
MRKPHCAAESAYDSATQEIYACYISVGDFQRRFGELLDRWSCTGDVGAALQAWTAIEVDSTILEMIAMLRASGYRCYLASNQEPYRARYMSETLRYKAAFDGEFYSCTVGHAKPAPAYFRAILEALAVRAEDTLFIDDLSTNVEAAGALGCVPPSLHRPPTSESTTTCEGCSPSTACGSSRTTRSTTESIGHRFPAVRYCASAAPWNHDYWSREVAKGFLKQRLSRKPLRRLSRATVFSRVRQTGSRGICPRAPLPRSSTPSANANTEQMRTIRRVISARHRAKFDSLRGERFSWIDSRRPARRDVTRQRGGHAKHTEHRDIRRRV